MTGKQPKRKPRPGVDPYGRSSLHYACAQGDMATVRQLLAERGADPGKENRHGVAPLGLARTIGNYDVAQFFKDLP